MAYNLLVTEKAEELIDASLDYLMNRLMNSQAAIHLLDELSAVYDRLSDNPYQFPECKDVYLCNKNYREAFFSEMNYKVIFRIEGETVYIVGLYNDLEDYRSKL